MNIAIPATASKFARFLTNVCKFALTVVVPLCGIVGAVELGHISVSLFVVAAVVAACGFWLLVSNEKPPLMRRLGVVFMMPCVLEGFVWLTCHVSLVGPAAPWGGIG